MILHLFAEYPEWMAAGANALRIGGAAVGLAADGAALVALSVVVLEIALAVRGDLGPFLHRGASVARQIARHLGRPAAVPRQQLRAA